MTIEGSSYWREGLPEGWHALFDRLVADIARTDPEATVREAKQKFGTLRIYLSRLSPEVEKLVDEACRRSGRTCERCGEPGKLTVSAGWYSTLSDRHRGNAMPASENPVLESFRAYGDGTIKRIDRS